MRSLRRSLCIVMLLFAFLAACGDDNDSNSKTTTNQTQLTSTTAARSPASSAVLPSTSAPASTIQNVTDGAVCPTANARGVTERGIPLVCTTIAGGNELRWRPQ